jgi:hypothetical protein
VPDIQFGHDGKRVFTSKFHGELTLSKTKWDIICAEPERAYYRANGEKIATTLINPDQVRRSQSDRNQFFYYKKFMRIFTDKGVEVAWPSGIFFAVVIDATTARICTVYPVEKPKPGKAFVPPKTN